MASLFAGKIIRPIADAVRAMDAAARTGIGVFDAWKALRTLRLPEEALAGIAGKILQTVLKACETAARAAPTAGARALAASGSTEECIRQALRDLVKDKDHIVLGVNPGSDDLTKIVGGRTFNGKEFGIQLPAGMGMGERPLWTVRVDQAVSNSTVRISVSLDGVAGAKNADEALNMLLARGETIANNDWGIIRSSGYGTAWEMVRLRAACRTEARTWKSIDWHMTNAKGEVEQVFPERFTYANGVPVD
ncbi:polymorphic toxin type 27 domain-containing protein [Streptomyces laurentii]